MNCGSGPSALDPKTMKTNLVVFLTVGLALNSPLPAQSANSVSDCDQSYSKRGIAALEQAVECYGSLTASLADDQKRMVFERTMIALSALVNDHPKTEAEGNAIAKALPAIEAFGKFAPESSDFFYWRAVFTSFDAIRKDRGSVLPRHLFAVIRPIQDDLRRAIERDPSVHVYGPHRVLGIMHTQMPGIVGGDKTLAEKMLKEAYTRAPQISLNHLAYARILQVNGKDELAKEVVTKFLARPDSELDPYPAEPLRSVIPELVKDRSEARKILDELNGD